MQASINLSHSQLELLKMIPPNVTDEELKEIKKVLVKYFAKKATEEANKLWEDKGFKSAKDMEKYLNAE